MKAVWKNSVIAQSDDIIKIEGNCYFPPDSVDHELLRESTTHTVCSWKGRASYYDVVVDGEVNPDAAWYYPDPNAKASQIKNYIAFWRGIKVAE